METKKYILAWLIWLIVTITFALLGFFWLNWEEDIYSEEDNELFSYVPKEFQQVFMARTESEFLEAIDWFFPEWYQEDQLDLLSNMEKIIVYQGEKEGETVNFMVARVTSDFDIQEAIDEQMLAEFQDYEYLEDDIIMYGNQTSFDYIDRMEDENILQNQDIENYLDDFIAREYNIAFFSTPDPARGQGQIDPMLVEQIDQLNYVVAMSKFKKHTSEGFVDILFDQDDLWIDRDFSFSPEFKDYTWDETIAYIELTSLPELMWIGTQELTIILETMVSQFLDEEYAQLVSGTDFQSLANAIDDNIWIIITKASNPVGIWWKIVFWEEGVYDMLETFQPMIAWLEEIPELEWEIVPIEGDNYFWVNVTWPMMMWLDISGEITVESKDWNTFINIFSPVDTEWSLDLEYNQDNILLYYLNLQLLVEFLGWFNINQLDDEVEDITNGLDIFEQGEFYGSLSYKEDRLRFDFNLNQ